jgi:CheY-like chemotaxis protein
VGAAGTVGPAAEMRVLVVDDDDDQRYLLRRLFLRAGAAEVLEADDGRTALAVVGEHAPDVVVLDLTMPGLSGMEALPLLRTLVACPIVVLSAMPARAAAADALARGAVGYLEKRMSTAGLVDEILLVAGLVAAAQQMVAGTFPADPASVAGARRFVRGSLHGQDQELLERVVLLTSELVTNAVLHAGTDARVEIRLTPGVVRVEVGDEGPGAPTIRDPDVGGPGGRGLPIVDHVASRWGVAPAGRGKVVWFEVDRPAT